MCGEIRWWEINGKNYIYIYIFFFNGLKRRVLEKRLKLSHGVRSLEFSRKPELFQVFLIDDGATPSDFQVRENKK